LLGAVFSGRVNRPRCCVPRIRGGLRAALRGMPPPARRRFRTLRPWLRVRGGRARARAPALDSDAFLCRKRGESFFEPQPAPARRNAGCFFHGPSAYMCFLADLRAFRAGRHIGDHPGAAGAQQLASSKPLGFAASEAAAAKGRKEQVLAEIKHVFRPEFLNRVDEILVFDALGRKELEQIADNMLHELNSRMAANGLSIELAPSARELLLAEGSDSKYGARPLRRALRKLVEDPVSDLYLAGKFAAGDKIIAEAAADKKLQFHTAVEGAQFLLELPIAPQPAACGSGKEQQHGEE